MTEGGEKKRKYQRKHVFSVHICCSDFSREEKKNIFDNFLTISALVITRKWIKTS